MKPRAYLNQLEFSVINRFGTFWLAAAVCTVLLMGGCNRVRRSSWIEQMTKKLPQTFCVNGSVFRECADVTVQQCLTTSRDAVEECLDRHRSELPWLLKQPEEGRYWGSTVGKCAAEIYFEVFKEKRLDNDACKTALSNVAQQL